MAPTAHHAAAAIVDALMTHSASVVGGNTDEAIAHFSKASGSFLAFLEANRPEMAATFREVLPITRP